MQPGERLDLIRALCAALWDEPYRNEVDDILDAFELPTHDEWDGDWDSYVRAMLRQGSDEALLSLAGYLGVEGPASLPGTLATSTDLDEGPWPDGGFRLFLSHISSEKQYVTRVKRNLERFQVWGFVAHEDIEPTREWVLEIERALRTCQALAAFLHKGFDRSRWTEQEVGFAVARGVPIIPIRAGLDPYGFIGRYQALRFTEEPGVLAEQVFRLLMHHPTTKGAIGESVVAMMENAASFKDARDKVPLLREYTAWTPELLDRLERSIDSNSQVEHAHGVPSAIRSIIVEHSGVAAGGARKSGRR